MKGSMMPTKLDRLLDSISPEKTIEDIYNRANGAINSFRFKKAQITQWDEFRWCIAEFSRHLDGHIMNLRKPVDISLDWYWGHSVRSLLKIYGINGEKAAFDMARTGNEGGLYAVLKAFAMRRAEDYSQSEITAKVLTFWDGLSVEEHFKTVDEYLQKYGHLFPSELIEGNAGRFRGCFWKVLQKHPELVQQIRQTGR